MHQHGLRCFILLSFLNQAFSGQRLNEYIRHFEPLSYDHEDVHTNHLRAKRSISDPFLEFGFHAYGRHFPIRLKRDTEILAENLVIEGPHGEIYDDVDMSHVYSGHLWGEDGTKVYGSIRNGVFEGKIHTPKSIYYVERSHKLFKGFRQPFHSVIYNEEDIRDPYEKQRNGSFGGCGVTEDVLQWMQDISNSAAEDKTSIPTAKKKDHSLPVREKRQTYDDYTSKYTEQAQRHVSYPEIQKNAKEKRTCTLFIQTDTYLWDHVYTYEQKETNVREEITSIIWQHVKAVNTIYESTAFDSYKGIRFTVQRIRINDTTACNTAEKRSQNPFCLPNIDVSNFLNMNSQSNHDNFCLAYIFTYRDFSGGTLGLAWVASVSGSSGGICEKYKSYIDKNGGREINIKRSLNTGVITFVNYNSRVPPKVSELTLAHEIGHNFGSPHDFPVECRPGGKDGNFIMYASATSGDRVNNNKFSTCSRRNISAVLSVVLREDGKSNCFEEDAGPFCGNKIVEEGEECDCGYDQNECGEQCCYPHDVGPYLKREPHAKACRLRTGRCSPSQGPCCNDKCEFVNSKTLCKKDSDCNEESYCNGRNASCPTPTPKFNKTTCNEGTQVCWNGECTGSICERYEFEECFLTEDNAKPEDMCQVACQRPNQTNTCKTTLDIPSMKSIKGIKLRPGSPCNDFKGYCDVFQKCRDVDAEGPLARLKNLLFNKKTLMSIRQWVTTHWWGVLLMLLGLIIFMGIFIKCCAVHTPSSNPRKAPALRIQDTLRRPADTLRRKRQNQRRQEEQRAANNAQQAQQAQQMQQLQQQQAQQVSLPPHSDPPPPYPGPRNVTTTASVQSTASPSFINPVIQPNSIPGPSVGPSHGYGPNRGHYNRREKQAAAANVAAQTQVVGKTKVKGRERTDENPYAPAYPGRANKMEATNKTRA